MYPRVKRLVAIISITDDSLDVVFTIFLRIITQNSFNNIRIYHKIIKIMIEVRVFGTRKQTIRYVSYSTVVYDCKPLL